MLVRGLTQEDLDAIAAVEGMEEVLDEDYDDSIGFGLLPAYNPYGEP